MSSYRISSTHTVHQEGRAYIPVYSGTCVIISILLALINKRNLHLKMAMAIGPKLALSLLGSFRWGRYRQKALSACRPDGYHSSKHSGGLRLDQLTICWILSSPRRPLVRRPWTPSGPLSYLSPKKDSAIRKRLPVICQVRLYTNAKLNIRLGKLIKRSIFQLHVFMSCSRQRSMQLNNWCKSLNCFSLQLVLMIFILKFIENRSSWIVHHIRRKGRNNHVKQRDISYRTQAKRIILSYTCIWSPGYKMTWSLALC